MTGLIALSCPFPFHWELHQPWKFSLGRERPALVWWLLKSCFWMIKISARKLCHLLGRWTAHWIKSLQTSRLIFEIRRRRRVVLVLAGIEILFFHSKNASLKVTFSPSYIFNYISKLSFLPRSIDSWSKTGGKWTFPICISECLESSTSAFLT